MALPRWFGLLRVAGAVIVYSLYMYALWGGFSRTRVIIVSRAWCGTNTAAGTCPGYRPEIIVYSTCGGGEGTS